MGNFAPTLYNAIHKEVGAGGKSVFSGLGSHITLNLL